MSQTEYRPHPRRSQGWFAVSWVFAGEVRTFAPRPWLCLALAGVLPLICAWYLAATVYLVFHDRLLASLIAHQTDMQYAYEDRIAGLQTQLTRETSRALVDRNTLETTVRDLETRGDALESRAEAINRLVSQSAAAEPKTKNAGDRVGSNGRDAGEPLTTEATGKHGDKRADLGDHAEAGSAIRATFARVEEKQSRILDEMRDPALRSIAKMRAALAEVGISPTRAAPETADVGGPFVPLTTGNLPIDQNLTVVEDAVLEAQHLRTQIASVPLRKPLPGPLEVTSPFGPRIDPFLGRAAMHTGVDLREGWGDAVHATAAGVVSFAGSDGGYGNMIEINHGNGLTTRYAHLSSVSVTLNQKVAAGEIIGHVGATGRATGPHLHYETRIDGQPVDPTRFLRAGAKLFES